MDPENLDQKSPNSPPSTENSIGRDYISSYTQISHFNNDQTQSSDQTDVESSDNEFSDEIKLDTNSKNNSTLPELSSQIVEWSKKVFEAYEENPNKLNMDSKQESSEQLEFFQMKFLMELESQAASIEENLNQMMNHINNFSIGATSTSVDVMKLYQDNVFDICDNIDSNIKLMYKIISKCEELNKSLKFIDDLKNRIKDIKQVLDILEKLIM